MTRASQSSPLGLTSLVQYSIAEDARSGNSTIDLVLIYSKSLCYQIAIS